MLAQRLNALPIAKRMTLGIGALLVMLIAVSVVAFVGIYNATADFTEYRAAARQTANGGDLASDVLTARINLREYVATGQAEDAQTAREAIKDSLETIQLADTVFVGDAREAFDAIRKDIETYAAGSEQLLRLAASEHALLAQFKARASANPDLQRAVIDVEDFHRSPSEKSGETVLSQLEGQPEASALFRKMETISLERATLQREKMDQLGPRIRKSLQALIDERLGIQNQLGPKVDADLKGAKWIVTSLSVLAVGLGLITGVMLSRSIVRPVTALTDAMTRLGNEELDTEVPAIDRADEVGEMARSVQVFKEGLIANRTLQAEQVAAQEREAQMKREQEAAERKAEADRLAAEEHARQERRRALLDMAEELDANVGQVVQSIASACSQLESLAESMAQSATSNTDQATSVAAATEETSASVQTVAAASEELAVSVQEIRRQMNLSKEVSELAVVEAKQAEQEVRGLQHAAEEIGRVIQLINDIAEQTNLLALNATIEAARAGEMGRGFAIVASEVKALANQTAQATNQISEKIDAIQSASGGSSEAIGRIASKIRELNDGTVAISAAVEQQGSSTGEIASNIQAVAGATESVAHKIVSISESSALVGESAQEVLTSASALNDQSRALRDQISDFLSQLRAA